MTDQLDRNVAPPEPLLTAEQMLQEVRSARAELKGVQQWIEDLAAAHSTATSLLDKRETELGWLKAANEELRNSVADLVHENADLREQLRQA